MNAPHYLRLLKTYSNNLEQIHTMLNSWNIIDKYNEFIHLKLTQEEYEAGRIEFKKRANTSLNTLIQFSSEIRYCYNEIQFYKSMVYELVDTNSLQTIIKEQEEYECLFK
jgi:hypothetical protein